jgi:cell fate (sporulation/competence/biofilm development) regulator YlbF (YheA/YmcA/DUF963 family)
MMHALPGDGAVIEKTRELCQTIVSQPDFLELRRDVDAFLSDDQARDLYRTVAEKGQSLHQRQHAGEALDQAEVAAFEQQREALMNNTVARRFVDAQERMHGIHETVGRYVMKALELGRVPEPGDFETCGQGCSCH